MLKNAHRTEAALIRVFVQAIRSTLAPFATMTVGSEFDYRDGRTDVISVSSDGELFAFEAKLTHWRVALHQAYRATAFAHRSYVVLPTQIAERAAAYVQEFERRKVGLCAVSLTGQVTILCEAPRVEPLLPWVSSRALAYLRGARPQ